MDLVAMHYGNGKAFVWFCLKVRSHQMRIARMINMLSQCKDAKDNPAALFARMRRRKLSECKKKNFGGYSRRVNQSGACSSSDVITSGGRKSETTMEDNVIVVVCGYPELYILRTFLLSSYFYKYRNTFCNETGAAWQKPLPWREFASVV